MAFTVSIDIIQCIIAEGKSCGGIVVWNMSRSKNKIKSLVENIFIIFYIIIAIIIILLVYHIYTLYPTLKSSFSAFSSALSADEKKTFLLDILKTLIPIIKDILFSIASMVLKSFLHKLTVNKEMQTALHSSNLQAYGYVSFNEEPFAQSTLDLFPKDCNISKGLIIQILSSDTQLFPIDYEITNIKVTAYDISKKRIKNVKCFWNDKQIIAYFDENSNSDKVTKSSLYKFIVDTFHLKRIGSNEPVINLNFKILYKKSYSFYKAKFHYMYKFSAKPTSGININGMFDLEMPHNIKKN